MFHINLANAKDFGSKTITLLVLGTLWGGAYTIYLYSGAPHKINCALTAGLAMLGLIWVFTNLKSAKPEMVKYKHPS